MRQPGRSSQRVQYDKKGCEKFQMELKIYEHHFYKADWQEFDKLIEAA